MPTNSQLAKIVGASVLYKIIRPHSLLGVRNILSQFAKTNGFNISPSRIGFILLAIVIGWVSKKDLFSFISYVVRGKKWKFAGLFDGELGFLNWLYSLVLLNVATLVGTFGPKVTRQARYPICNPPNTENVSQVTLNEALIRLDSKKTDWLTTPLQERAKILRVCLKNFWECAEEVVAAAMACKGSYEGGAGEERLVVVNAAMMMRETAEALECGGQPSIPEVYTRSDGQKVAHVFPGTWWEQQLFTGWRGEVWLKPGEEATQGSRWKATGEAERKGEVCCILGAGNQLNLTFHDITQQMFMEDKVVVCKVNPVMAWLKPFLQRTFAPLIEAGFLEVVGGGAQEGQFLCNSGLVSSVHMTGAADTFDKIVWQGAAKQEGVTPPVGKPVHGELGGVTPYLIVPGEWSKSDIRYHARSIVSGLVLNASHNCLAAQVLITAKDWPQRTQFLNAIRAEMKRAQPRASFYPGTKANYTKLFRAFPENTEVLTPNCAAGSFPWILATDLPTDDCVYLQSEVWCGALGEVPLPPAWLTGSHPGEFLQVAAQYCNRKVWGNLSCAVFIDPHTQASHAPLFDHLLSNLKYGTIVVNAPVQAAWATTRLTWGGFPGNPVHDIQSGNVVTHNTLLLDHPEKSVCHVPWRVCPAPFWFYSNRAAEAFSKAALPIYMDGCTQSRLATAMGAALLAGPGNES